MVQGAEGIAICIPVPQVYLDFIERIVAMVKNRPYKIDPLPRTLSSRARQISPICQHHARDFSASN